MGLEVKSVWDPYEVLDLDPDVRNTCVGRAPSKGNAPCRLPVCLADRKLASNALNAMARGPSKITPKSLEKLACLLLCKRYHQYQISEMVKDWTERINDFQDLNQLQDKLEEAKKKAKEDRQESKAAKKLLWELTQRVQEAEKLRKQLSKAQKAEEEALQAKARAEVVSQDLSTQLDDSKRLARKVLNRALKLRLEKRSLEDKLCSRERDLTDAKKSEEKLTEELVLVRDQLGEMLCNPPSGEPWWAINCELSFESTYNIIAEVRKAFADTQSTVAVAQQQLSIRETDNSTLRQTLTSAQAETETTKKRLLIKEKAYTTLQQQLASTHARLNTRNQQLALREETISKTQQELTSNQEVVRTTKQQLTHQVRVNLQNQVEASSTIAELEEDMRVLHRRREEAERRIAVDDEYFSALRLGGIRVGIFVLVVGALQMLGRR